MSQKSHSVIFYIWSNTRSPTQIQTQEVEQVQFNHFCVHKQLDKYLQEEKAEWLKIGWSQSKWEKK